MSNNIRNVIGPFDAPFINVESTIVQPGMTNGVPNIKKCNKRVVAPTPKKIGTYIVNQIFGSDLLIEAEGVNVNWLMPTLRKTLEEAIYSQESFIYIHAFNGKIYLENIKKKEIHDLVQKWDMLKSGTIIQDIQIGKDLYILKRHFNIDITTNITYLTFKAYKREKDKEVEISIDKFNMITGNEYESNYIIPYKAIINIDIGEDFFGNSKKLIEEEMKILNILASELDKTKTKIVTSQHFQTSDIVTSWTPGNTSYKVDTLTVGDLQDYFTLLPGDKEHKIFEYLQGNIRVEQYEKAFKFYDYQIIQQAGLSTASFGYEKDAYMNVANVSLAANATEMTIEAIKTQITNQINELFENIIKAQTSLSITENVIPVTEWDFGSNERFDDMKKIQVMNKLQSVASIPYSIKLEVILPILKKIIDNGGDSNIDINKVLEEHNKEQEKININFGEI